MDETEVTAVVRPLAQWSTQDLRRAHRLTAAEVRAAVLQGRDDDIAAPEEDAATFALELVRRGEL
jgi:hypothetical protein